MLTKKLFGLTVGFLLVVVLALTVSTLIYKTLYDNTSISLGSLQDSVKNQNTEATAKLARMTEDRDQKQAQLDQAARNQEATDALALAEINRLSTELDARPVRVRYVTASGQGSGGATGETAATTQGSAGDASTASGVLPEANSRRLKLAIAEVEKMSVAYASCRARLIPEGSIAAAETPNWAALTF